MSTGRRRIAKSLSLLVLLALSSAAALAGEAEAVRWELGLGAALHKVPPTSLAVWFSRLGRVRPRDGWDWRPEIVIAGVTGRDGADQRRPDVALLGAGVRVGRGDFFVGGALAVASSTTPELSSHHQFISTVGWRRERLGVVLRHVSNGSTRGPNDGENLLAVTVYF